MHEDHEWLIRKSEYLSFLKPGLDLEGNFALRFGYNFQVSSGCIWVVTLDPVHNLEPKRLRLILSAFRQNFHFLLSI